MKTGAYYIGSTENLEQRLKFHNIGRVKSTKTRKPWLMVFSQDFHDLSDARKRELQIKAWKSRRAIERLIGTFNF